MNQWAKFALGLAINLVCLYFLFSHMDISKGFEAYWIAPATFSLTLGLIVFSTFLSAFRLKLLLEKNSCSQSFLRVLRVSFVASFVAQLLNLFGTTDICKLALLDGDKKSLLKVLVWDKALVLLGAFSILIIVWQPLCLLASIVFLWPPLSKIFFPFVLSQLTFLCLSGSLAICSSHPEQMGTAGKILLSTALFPLTVSDWGVREYLAFLWTESDQSWVIGAASYGVVLLIGSLPGGLFMTGVFSGRR